MSWPWPGAVGKTTTKELLANAVSRRWETLRTAGSFNNELGLPITLLGLTAAQEMAVLEIGISEVGEMTTRAVAGADVGVMTRIVPEHMAFPARPGHGRARGGRLIEALLPPGWPCSTRTTPAWSGWPPARPPGWYATAKGRGWTWGRGR